MIEYTVSADYNLNVMYKMEFDMTNSRDHSDNSNKMSISITRHVRLREPFIEWAKERDVHIPEELENPRIYRTGSAFQSHYKELEDEMNSSDTSDERKEQIKEHLNTLDNEERSLTLQFPDEETKDDFVDFLFKQKSFMIPMKKNHSMTKEHIENGDKSREQV